ncbi:MAG: AarF/UbiB family protein [Eubacteriaceae bacterium]|nr:AarF/UbiB family protein [Eubacteriaceae bacterium]MDD4507506.1 AarF/UbiB family protein [Eubacteriaceae bacterium]
MTMLNNDTQSRYTAERGVTRSYRHKRLREITGILSRHEITKGLTPEKLRLIIEDLGPTFVKLGQILSMRQDILPVAYCKELEKLRTDVKPLPFSTIRDEIEKAYGLKLREIFKTVDPKPLGSASIAQVHKAELLDGSEVVVKVQRPGIYNIMALDMALLDRVTTLIKISGATGNAIDFKVVLDEMWISARQEMDFLIEARNAETFAVNNRDVLYVTSPKIYHQYTTSNVLMMRFIDGTDINFTDTLKEQGYDLKEIAEKLAENYIKQVIDDAFFHADPHPGNIRIHDGKIAWIDLGMMGTLSRRDSELFREAITSIATKNVESLTSVVLTLGVHSGFINHSRLYADIDDLFSQYGSTDIGNLNLGKMMQQVLNICNYHHISMPKGITMLVRSAMTLEGVIEILDPQTNVVEIMIRHLSSNQIGEIHLRKNFKKNAMLLYGAGKNTLEIPHHVVDLLKSTLRGQTKINLEITGSEEPLERIDSMVNRIVTALITAALLIGSSFIATTHMTPVILGIPALGFIGYFVAVILGGVTLIDIYRGHRKKHKKRH